MADGSEHVRASATEPVEVAEALQTTGGEISARTFKLPSRKETMR